MSDTLYTTVAVEKIIFRDKHVEIEVEKIVEKTKVIEVPVDKVTIADACITHMHPVTSTDEIICRRTWKYVIE